MREYKLNRPAGHQPQAPAQAEMNDLTPMPFGKHKDTPMQDVPANYLLWLWDNGVHKQPGKPIHAYIKKSFSALMKECPDYIAENMPGRE